MGRAAGRDSRVTLRATRATASAYVRAAHQLQRRFDVSPGLGFLRLALLFAGASLLGGLGDRRGPMGLEQLSGIILDFDFSIVMTPSSSHSE